jgi:hypothetical protein
MKMQERILSAGDDPALHRMKPETEPEVLSADGSEPVSLVPRGEEDMLEMPDGTFVTRDEFESAMNKGRRMAQVRAVYRFRAQRMRRQENALFVTVRKRMYRCTGRGCDWTGHKPTVEYTGRRRKLCPECGAAVERMDS